MPSYERSEQPGKAGGGRPFARLLFVIIRSLALLVIAAYVARWLTVRLRPIRLEPTPHSTPPIRLDEAQPPVRRIVVSDLHLGGGDRLDDFDADDVFVAFVLHYVRSTEPTELILAGDTFEFLQVRLPGVDDDDWSPEAAVRRIEAIMAAHPRPIRALAHFVAHPGSQLTVLVGNHDFELHYTPVKERLAVALGLPPGDCRLRFGIRYEGHGIYLEHGNQFDPWNRFVYFEGICQPFEVVRGTQLVKEVINELEEDALAIAPLVDNVKPSSAFFWYLVALPRLRNPAARRFVTRGVIGFLQIAAWPTPYHMPITGHGPGGWLSGQPVAGIWRRVAFIRRRRVVRQREVARQVGNVAASMTPPDNLLEQVETEANRQVRREIAAFHDRFAREMLRRARTPAHRATRLFVCGHTHAAQVVSLGQGQQYINTGTWTEIIEDIATMRRQEQRYPFLEITYPRDGQPLARLLVWRGVDEPPRPWYDGPGIDRGRQRIGGFIPLKVRRPRSKEVVV